VTPMGLSLKNDFKNSQWLISQWSFLDCSASAFFWRTQSRPIALNRERSPALLLAS
jgi:hypothetical protein